jgi:FkbM family methyltransferase
MDHVSIRLSDGVTLAVPASLKSISTYVLLEQETWFEKECAFVGRWLKPGMTVIDIGANIGVYSLPMAMRVAPSGRVIAYEPASEPRRLLGISQRLNQANNLEIVAAALSDGERQGHLVFGTSSELNALGSAGPGEAVRITSLDREGAAQSWPSPDFVKIDAEGEEERILPAARPFSIVHSPLVLFEIRRARRSIRSCVPRSSISATTVIAYSPANRSWCAAIRAPRSTITNSTFSRRSPDRARRLAEDGYLVDPLRAWEPDANARSAALDALKARPFARVMNFDAVQDPDYLDGLAGYAQWRDRTRPVAQRCEASPLRSRHCRHCAGAHRPRRGSRRSPALRLRLGPACRMRRRLTATSPDRKSSGSSAVRAILAGLRPLSTRSRRRPGRVSPGLWPWRSNISSARPAILRYSQDNRPTCHGYARSPSPQRRWNGADFCRLPAPANALTCRQGCGVKRPIISTPRYGVSVTSLRRFKRTACRHLAAN